MKSRRDDLITAQARNERRPGLRTQNDLLPFFLVCRADPARAANQEKGEAGYWVGSGQHLLLDIRTSRRIIGQESLIMRNLRTKAQENVGCRYTNQPTEGNRG